MTSITPFDKPEKESAQSPGPSRIWLIVTALIFGTLIIANLLRPEPKTGNEFVELGYVTQIETSQIGAFELSHYSLPDDGTGELNHSVADSSLFKGQWSLVFFGFTSCPDVCPTTLSVLNKVAQEMGQTAPQIILVSVDPGRDTPAILTKYLRAFNQDFVALSGTDEQITNLAYQLQAVFFKPSEDDGFYMVDHSTNIALINPNAEHVGNFKIPPRENAIVKALNIIMSP